MDTIVALQHVGRVYIAILYVFNIKTNKYEAIVKNDRCSMFKDQAQKQGKDMAKLYSCLFIETIIENAL